MGKKAIILGGRGWVDWETAEHDTPPGTFI